MVLLSRVGRELYRIKQLNHSRLQNCLGQRWVQISALQTGDGPLLDQLAASPTVDFSTDTPDAKFEVLGAPFSILAASLSASQPLYARRGSLVGVSGKLDSVVSRLSVLEPLRRAPLGIPFLYQKITSASPITTLISTKSANTSFTTLYLDGTLDWMVTQRNALLAWTGQTLSLQPRVNFSLSLANWGNTQVTGRGLLALAGKGQIYQVNIKNDEHFVVHPSNVLAYTVTKTRPQPHRFRSSAIRLEVPGFNSLRNLLFKIRFFQVVSKSSSWKFLSKVFFTLRTWSRRTIWGDSLFLQFHGPSTILLQTRASRISDVLTSREVDEIADTEPGALGAAIRLDSQKVEDEEKPPARIPTSSPKMSYATVTKDGGVKFEKSST